MRHTATLLTALLLVNFHRLETFPMLNSKP